MIEDFRQRATTAVVGDVLDVLGRYHQMLPAPIRPLREGMRIVGRAAPVLVGKVFGPQAAPFGRLTAALDALAPGEVYLSTGADVEAAGWGEILTAAALARGAVGAIVDGYHRDTAQVLAQQWPVFSRGACARDSAVRSAVLDFGVPIEVAGVAIAPGDLIVGDVDGVVVIPQHLEKETIERALTKLDAENRVLADIRAGISTTEAFARHGVL